MADPRFRSTEYHDDDARPRTRGYDGARESFSSARDYEAAGVIGSSRTRADTYRDRDRSYGGTYGSGYRPDSDSEWDRDYSARGQSRRHGQDYDYDRSRRDRDYDRARDQDRGFFDRAGDEIRSWFGDEEAERRRERDMRQSDRDYSEWRARQVAHLDRDYAEYRRENAQKFANEFGSWRAERQGQRTALERVQEHMEVVGTEGDHIGTVDKVRGDRILLTKSDNDAGGHHHSIPSRWIESVSDKQVIIRKTAAEAKAHWRDEERSGAFFNESDDTNRDAYSRSSWMMI
jgi:hypothetical protein